jgi:glycosyltransferase involved in cell wall biosynthesis
MAGAVSKGVVAVARRLLLIGPLPPPNGGVRASFSYLLLAVKSQSEFEIEVVEYPIMKGGVTARWLLEIKQLLRACSLISQSDIVSFHASTNRFLVAGMVIRVVTNLWGKALVFRIFGSGIEQLLTRGPHVQIALRYLMRTDAILLQTKALVNDFRRFFPTATILWFPTSRPLTKFQRTIPPSRDMFRFAYFGKIRPDKGVLDILQAVDLLRDDNFSVDFYGELQTGMDKALFERMPKVTYRGLLKPYEVPARIADYDAVLLPTTYVGEGYPGIIIEAFTQGVPVIATRWRSIPELIKHHENGILIEPHRPEELASAMRALMENEALQQDLAAHALDTAKEFSSDFWNREAFLNICLDAAQRHTCLS